jgi:hypothetical protein
MSQWTERVERHQVFGELREFEKAIERCKSENITKEGVADHLDRAQAVLAYASQVLSQSNPLLVTPGQLNNLASTLQQARAEVEGYNNTGNLAHWINAQGHLDNAAVYSASFPQLTADGVGNLRESASAYRASVGQLMASIRRDGEAIANGQRELDREIKSTMVEVSKQKQRLDVAIASFQQQFSDAQQTRQTEHAASEKARTAAAISSEKDRQAIYDEAEGARNQAAYDAVSSAHQAHKELVAKLALDSEHVLIALEGHKTHAQKLIGIISDTGMAHGFQKTANEERDEAAVWKRVAALSLIAWIFIGGVFFALTYDKDLTLAAVGRQFLLSTPFVLLSGFAALQVSLHQRNQRKLRQAELEIASIDPFLATLSDQDRNEVKREFASRYFGQKDTEQKHEATSPKLWELTETLAKLVQEMTRKTP